MFLIRTPRDLAIRGGLIPRESRHALEKNQPKLQVCDFWRIDDVSVPNYDKGLVVNPQGSEFTRFRFVRSPCFWE